MPLISIIVPVYNSELYLSFCIESILSQSLQDFELILIDDGSTDRSGSICDEFAQKHENIKVIHQNNQGQAAARNIGLNLSSGQWITYIDSDDAIHERYLEILFDGVKNTNNRISMCYPFESEIIDYAFLKREVSPEWQSIMISENHLDYLYQENYFCGIVWAKLISRDIAKQIAFSSGRYYEDNAVACKLLYYAKCVAFSFEPLYWYRENPSGTTKGDNQIKKKIDLLWAIDEQIRFLRDIGYITLSAKQEARYFVESAWIYFYIKTKDKKLAKRIKIETKKRYKRSSSRFLLTLKQLITVMEMFHPVIISLYWRLQNGKDKTYNFSCGTGL